MSLSYNGYSLAELRVEHVTLIPSIGGFHLNVNISFTKNGSERSPILVRDARIRIDISRPSGGAPHLLGFTNAPPHWNMTIQKYSQVEYGTFDLNLSEGQLAAVEDLRGNGGLRFHISLVAATHGPNGILPVQDSLTWEANLSKWTDILHTAGIAEYLVVAIPISPRSGIDPSSSGLQHVRRAHKFFLEGDYASVVSECRLALDGIESSNGQKDVSVSGANSVDRRSMSKAARLQAIQAAARHFTHLAHHTSAEGDPDIFSRADATLTLGVTGALFKSTISRQS